MKKQLVLLMTAALLSAPSVRAQTRDISPDHWAFPAVQSLAARGLVLGYPDGNFLGNRTLTRYEMASLLKRVVDRLENRPAPGETAPASPAPSLTAAEKDQILKLVEEFKVELAVIGTDLSTLKQRLDAQEQRLDAVERSLEDIETTSTSLSRTVDDLKKTKVSGYIQFRWQNRSDSTDNLLPGGVQGNQNYFHIRRGRVKIAHTFRPLNQFVFQVDGSNGNAVEVKDAYLSVPLRKPGGTDTPPTLTAGQFLTPFDFELLESSAAREFPERSRGIRILFPGLWDRGIKVEGTLNDKSLRYALALINGGGIQDSSRIPGSASTTFTYKDPNARKDVTGRLVYTPRPQLSLGASFYAGTSSNPTGETTLDNKEIFGLFDRDRYGVEAVYQALPGTTLKGEYITGRDYNTAERDDTGIASWWAQVTQALGSRNAVAVRYDVWDPNTGTPSPLAARDSYVAVPTLGVMAYHLINDATRLTLAYEMPHLPRQEDGTRADQDLTTVQLQYRF